MGFMDMFAGPNNTCAATVHVALCLSPIRKLRVHTLH